MNAAPCTASAYPCAVPRGDIASEVLRLMSAHDSVNEVQLVGSRATGRSNLLSDWDFALEVNGFPHVADDLPRLLAQLDPLAQQWDRLSDEQCFMLLLRGPAKIDLIFQEPHVHEPPWRVTAETLTTLDAHFWDWTLWLGSKQLGGKHQLVRDELAKMTEHLLGPAGIERLPSSLEEAIRSYLPARASLETSLSTAVPRRIQHEVMAGFRRAGLAVP